MSDTDKTDALDALKMLNRKQMEALSRRLDWFDTHMVGISNEKFRKRIRNQAETALEENGEVDWNSFLKYIRNEFIDSRHEKTDARIEGVLNETNIMPLDESKMAIDREEENRKEWRKKELWYSAQLYGALRNEFSTKDRNPHKKLPLSDHTVYRENKKWGLAVDLYVKDEFQDERYIIEVKRAESISSEEEILNQIRRYNAVFEEREHTYLLIVQEEDSGGSETREDIEDMINEAGDLRDVTVVSNSVMNKPRS